MHKIYCIYVHLVYMCVTMCEYICDMLFDMFDMWQKS